MRPRSMPNLPLSSFDPRYKELLLRGATAEFSLPCSTLQEARALRARIHTYRSRAKQHFGEADKAEWEPLYLCVIYLEKGPPIKLRFAPRSSEFDNILSQINYAKATPAPPPPESGADDLLQKLEAEQEAHEGKT